MASTTTAGELAERLQGECVGNADLILSGIADLNNAMPNEVSFLGNRRYLSQARATRAGAVLVARDDPADFHFTQIRVDNPTAAFSVVISIFTPPEIKMPLGVSGQAHVDQSARIGNDVAVQAGATIEAGAQIGDRCVIMAGAYIGHEAQLGSDCRIYPGACIRERCLIGNRVIIHCNAVIGSDGYGYELVDGRHAKIPQVGIVQIDDDVEIGACTTIDRARFSRTWIKKGVKIDNLVMVAHNVTVDEHSLLVAQVGVSGSTRIGKYVTLAGQVGIVGHLEVGDRVVIGSKSALYKNIPPGEMWTGSPARPFMETRRAEAHVQRLPDLFKRVKVLEARLAELEAREGA